MELDDLARRITDGLARWAARGNAVARWALRGVGGLALVTWALGLVVLHGTLQFPVWTVGGLVLCTLPALGAASVVRATRTTIASTGQIYGELRSGTFADDARDTLAAAATTLGAGEAGLSIRRLAGQLWDLRGVLADRREELTSAWAAVRSLTTMPARLAWTAVGSVFLAAVAIGFLLVATIG